jgi:Flp pilus assembly pilin Flp
MHVVESLSFEHHPDASRASDRPKPVASTVVSFDCSKGGENEMTFSEWFDFVRAMCKKEEGQTMAEYGVVLAVITLLIVGTLTALSGGINNALNNVIGVLP